MISNENSFDPVNKLSQQLDIGFALEATGLGVWELDMQNNIVLWDDRCRELFGLAKDNYLPYESALRYIHSKDVDRVTQAVQQAVHPGSDGRYDQTYRTIGADDGKLRWVRFYGQAYFSETGKLLRFAGIAHEVTDQKIALERELSTNKESQRQQRILEAISGNTPDLMYVFDLNYRFTYVNAALLAMWGSTWEKSIGKGLLENGYEPWHAQMHEREIDQVVATKQLIRGEVSFPHAVLGRRVYDYVFVPVFNEYGEVEAVAGTTRDISDIISSKQALQEKEAALSNAIEVAGLRTWSIDITGRTCSFSTRVDDWFGFDKGTVPIGSLLDCIIESDRQQVYDSMFNDVSNSINNQYDQVFSIINVITGHKRIIHMIGRIYTDNQQQPIRIEGSAQDITAEREMTTLLEQQVKQRTEELAAMNGKLAASNDKLEQANRLLVSSNNNLQTFAYVASHDLQEPLRKIQQFGTLLVSNRTNLSEKELGYIERMQSAAKRMGILIEDLLDFSRISDLKGLKELVQLNKVIEGVLTTLDLSIIETGAQITVGILPEIQGDASQIAQLFQNLISNVIKFQHSSIVPVIYIDSKIVAADQLPPSVKPSQPAKFYHQIDVEDNGIGFEEQYLDRIFQVFQRLHGKNAFPGTGIGLAICQKVADNLGGAITAHSQPGHGSTFTAYIPA